MNIYHTKVFIGPFADLAGFKAGSEGQRISSKQASFDNTNWTNTPTVQYQIVGEQVICMMGFEDEEQKRAFANHVSDNRTWEKGIRLGESGIDDASIIADGWVE